MATSTESSRPIADAPPRRRSRPGALRRLPRQLIRIVGRAISPSTVDALRGRWTVATAVFLVVTAGTMLRLLWPIPLGAREDSTAWTLLCRAGLAQPFGSSGTGVWSAYEWAGTGCGLPESGELRTSAATPLFMLARTITPWFAWGDGRLDVRAIGIIASILLGLALAVLTAVLPGGIGFRLLTAGAVWLCFIDGRYVGLLASVRIEWIVLIGSVIAVVGLIAYWRNGRARPEGAVMVALGGLAMVLVDVRLIGVAVVLAVALMIPGMLRRRLTGWLTAALAAAALLVGSGAAVLTTPREDATAMAYDGLFDSALHLSPDPGRDLRQLGLPDSLTTLGGTRFRQSDGTVSDAAATLYRQGLPMPGLGEVVGFTLSHPERVVLHFDSALQRLRTTDPTVSVATSTLPRTDVPYDRGFPVMSFLLHTVAAGVPFAVLLISLAILGFALAVASRPELPLRARAVGRTTLTWTLALLAMHLGAVLTPLGTADAAGSLDAPLQIATLLQGILGLGCVLILLRPGARKTRTRTARRHRIAKSAGSEVPDSDATMASAARLPAVPSP